MNNEKRLESRTALITGGGRGIGRSIALALAREGADVAICARTEKQLHEVAGEIERLGRRCFVRVCDVTRGEDCRSMAAEAIEHLGRIDVLVNNAGGGDVADHRMILETDDQSLYDNIALNLYSTWYFCKALLPHMSERRYGRIVNVSSLAGLQGSPGLGAYAAAKHGVVGLSRTLALEYGRRGITCNVICPGPTRAGWSISQTGAGKIAEKMGVSLDEYNDRMVKTFSAIKRMIEPEEVAEAVLYFASEASGGTTGQAVSVCGGVNMH